MVQFLRLRPAFCLPTRQAKGESIPTYSGAGTRVVSRLGSMMKTRCLMLLGLCPLAYGVEIGSVGEDPVSPPARHLAHDTELDERLKSLSDRRHR